MLDAAGFLDVPGLSFTRGECVSIGKGLADPSGASGDSFAAGICGIESSQNLAGANNKGERLKVLKPGL